MTNKYAVGPDSTRTFAGFKLKNLDRDKFYSELGKTFMPGTPYMQAPMGLNAYLPAVFDIGEFSGELEEAHLEVLPDEVALIVYANIEIYSTARRLSLRRRMYTHSHRAVFDMDAPLGGGQFPVPYGEASPRPDGRDSWHYFNDQVDWQEGISQVFFIVPESKGGGSPEDLSEHLETIKKETAELGADQVLVLATSDYAVIWTHASNELDVCKLNFTSGGYTKILRSLTAKSIGMPDPLEEDMSQQVIIEGINITESSMFNFRFKRDDRFHPSDQE